VIGRRREFRVRDQDHQSALFPMQGPPKGPDPTQNGPRQRRPSNRTARSRARAAASAVLRWTSIRARGAGQIPGRYARGGRPPRWLGLAPRSMSDLAAQDVEWRGSDRCTPAIWKEPVGGGVGGSAVSKTSRATAQGDLGGHGGEQAAPVFVYQVESYRHWEQRAWAAASLTPGQVRPRTSPSRDCRTKRGLASVDRFRHRERPCFEVDAATDDLLPRRDFASTSRGMAALLTGPSGRPGFYFRGSLEEGGGSARATRSSRWLGVRSR
jgi:hypothetical protein